MADLQAEVAAQAQELARQSKMLRVMRQRMEEAEAVAAQVVNAMVGREWRPHSWGHLLSCYRVLLACGQGCRHAVAAPGGGVMRTAAVPLHVVHMDLQWSLS